MTDNKNISIKDVAKQANVSTATVSHVINGTRFVSEETKQKVHQAMDDLNYRINSVARSLRSRKSFVIAFLAPILASETSNFFFMSVAAGIQSVLKQHQYHLVLSDSHEEEAFETDEIRMLGSQMIDGLIMAPSSRELDYERLFGDYPVIYLDRVPVNCRRDSVVVDNKTVSKEAVQMLIAKGHTRIAYLSGPLTLTTTEERYAGYLDALSEAGIAPDPSLIRIGEVSLASGSNMTESLLQEQPTAIFVTDNVMAMGVISYLQEKKINVPDRMAVVAYDEFQWTRITSPPLTVIEQPAFELGVKAAEVMLERIDNATASLQEHRLTAKLIVRQSS
ncbi:LacI family DNA-binding transcriptional regulator [Paenibacillus sp. LHD-117]|uniref:LacI family DNA-binding transcriptional regulator n=1 Tax=Paenibacillus sp. LHD-117 TaxID=3071412 RepID=UPI0027E00684|nr:LacI family DNA-binding transcriptional regulator [Paenibacillus sp. LHD-117]MDQ6421713.1 LacI family DNA-binding transcriptional regulator [Paenibacillus sp. LHD-117]